MAEKGCVFCEKRMFGNLVLAESDQVMIILNKYPNNIEGHTMIIPKHHYEDFTKIDATEFAHLCVLTQGVAAAFLTEGSFPSIRVVIMQGKEAGASVRHSHIHIIPLKRDEPPPLPRKPEERREVTTEEIEKFKKLFENFLN